MGKEAVVGKHAPDVTKDIGEHERTPGKTTRVQGPGASGDEYVDQGPYKGPDSFLTDAQRQRLTSAFQQRVLAAEGNYQHAAIDVRVDKLLEKDEDLNWMASMLIDLAFGFVVGQVAKALIAVRDVKSAHVKEMFENHIPGFGVNDAEPALKLKDRAYRAMGKLTDDHIKGALGSAAGIGKTQATGQINKARSGESNRKEAIGYIDQLRDAASVAYQKMREVPPATATDAELLLLFESMDAQHHLISQYKLALQEKLARFEASKVTKIGRNFENRATFLDDGSRLPHSGERVIRDVWVEWHTFESESPAQLVFQYQDGHESLDVIEPDEPGVVTNAEVVTGHKVRKLRKPYEDPRGGISNDPKSIYVVPEEFRETAILRHKQMWGTAPDTVHIDESLHPQLFTPDRVKQAAQNKAKKAQVKKMKL